MRFVVLRHELPPGHARALHWDLMLQWGEALRTWAMSSEPAIGACLAAEQLPDHRLEYLDYEGPVSGGRGTVKQFDRGTFTIERDDPTEVIVELSGAALRGRLRLVQQAAGQPHWEATFMPPASEVPIPP